MNTIDLAPVLGQPWRTVRQYVTQSLGLGDRLDGASDSYALGYLSRAVRMDLGKICKKGDPCGVSCISSTKTCSPEKKKLTTKASIELSAKAKGANPKFAKAAGEASDRPTRQSKVTHMVSDFEKAKERRAAKTETAVPKLGDLEGARLKKSAKEALSKVRGMVEADPELAQVFHETWEKEASKGSRGGLSLVEKPEEAISKSAKKLLESMQNTDRALAEMTKESDRIKKKDGLSSEKASDASTQQVPVSEQKEIHDLSKQLYESMQATDKALAAMTAEKERIQKKYSKRKADTKKTDSDLTDSFWQGYYNRMVELQ